MKRGIAVLLSLCVLVTVAYFTASKWAIRHETLTFYDAARDNRPVAVDIAVRRDKEMQANAGMITLPVAVLNHGNTVKFTEYSFLANVFAARGYIAVSIQHDLPTDPPMVTKVGELYVGRQPQYLRGVANIKFAVERNEEGPAERGLRSSDHGRTFRRRRHLDVFRQDVSRSDQEGRDARQSARAVHDRRQVQDPVVPLQGSGVQARSRRRFPPTTICEKAGITVVQTGFQHNDMRDTGPDEAKASIQDMLDKFLDDDSPLRPADTTTPPLMTDAGPVAPYAPVPQRQAPIDNGALQNWRTGSAENRALRAH